MPEGNYCLKELCGMFASEGGDGRGDAKRWRVEVEGKRARLQRRGGPCAAFELLGALR
jgi:hypothetical protein